MNQRAFICAAPWPYYSPSDWIAADGLVRLESDGTSRFRLAICFKSENRWQKRPRRLRGKNHCQG
jgi:hypothetical protein